MILTGKCKEAFEEWKDVEELNCDYQISNLGRIKSKSRIVEFVYPTGNRFRHISEKILKPKVNKTKDRIDSVQYKIRDKSFVVNRLVYLYFGSDFENSVIYHLDKNPLNNCISNLKKGTWSESRKVDYQKSERTKEWQKERSIRGANAMKEKAIKKANEIFNNLKE